MNQAFESTDRRDTKDRILDTAERLFADHGFAATSLRQITTEAEVNLAAVNYHFKSKEVLLGEVIKRRLGPVNRRRLELLNELEAASNLGTPGLRETVLAFVRPAFEAKVERAETMRHFSRLMARVLAEPGEWIAPVMLPAMEETTQRFLPVFQKAMGVQSRATFFWGIQFSVGCMTRCLIAPDFIQAFCGETSVPESMEQMLDRVVCFIVGGLEAMAEREKSL